MDAVPHNHQIEIEEITLKFDHLSRSIFGVLANTKIIATCQFPGRNNIIVRLNPGLYKLTWLLAEELNGTDDIWIDRLQ